MLTIPSIEPENFPFLHGGVFFLKGVSGCGGFFEVWGGVLFDEVTWVGIEMHSELVVMELGATAAAVDAVAAIGEWDSEVTEI